MQYASFGARFLAFLLDVVVFFVLSEIFDLFLRLARIFGNSVLSSVGFIPHCTKVLQSRERLANRRWELS
jgi:uncharacterized RDD family membrane protein YckC